MNEEKIMFWGKVVCFFIWFKIKGFGKAFVTSNKEMYIDNEPTPAFFLTWMPLLWIITSTLFFIFGTCSCEEVLSGFGGIVLILLISLLVAIIAMMIITLLSLMFGLIWIECSDNIISFIKDNWRKAIEKAEKK